MRKWLGIMLMPDGEVPMFNDCFIGHNGLERCSRSQHPMTPLTVLEPLGYVG